ncbi:copper chaperone PCu(A)C, partial [Luteimonas sp. J16]|uniref:copper chaperone PCu(A)C n=2 Tax=unclassified Luteimonas TaxID=2629088 RepID=UPI0011A720D7
LAIRNHGGEDDRLVEVRSDAAQRVEIHEVRHEDGMARMRPLPDGLPLPAGEAVELRPGGYHLMFIGPGDGFVAGRSVSATLVFERAGELAVEFEVRAIAAQSPAGGHEHH